MTNIKSFLDLIDTMRKKETFWCCTGQCEHNKKVMLDTIDKLASHLTLLRSERDRYKELWLNECEG